MAGIRIAFSGTHGAHEAAGIVSSTLGAQTIRFDDLLETGARGLYRAFGFAYTRDEAVLHFIRNWARSVSPTLFLSSVTSRITTDGNYVISDLSRSEDAIILRDLNFVLVKIKKPVSTDTSLANDNKWDYEVRWCGLGEHLQWQLSQLLKLMKAGEHTLSPRRTTTIL